MKQKILKVHPDDNVLVALTNLSRGETLTYNGESFILQDDIPAKHKFVTRNLAQGDSVIMYGVLVGKAQTDIPKGGIISTANIKHAAEPFFYRKTDFHWTAPDVSRFANRTFNGYHRSNGEVGTANYWLFIPTVFCENRNLDVIREALHNELGYAV
ncbi:MAG TPA: UxaA family hydrolase, partial [Ferruginibacter sp.]|nr:UxaA family hydrolase [Ferruginibacter sp.]